jgi:AcrR family transcriptional regulator
MLRVPESGPKRKLLEATERLVVEKGFDLVSVRDITGAVKANVAAVNYHFGSREGLMDLVILHVLEAVDAARLEALEGIRVRAAGKPLKLEELVGGYVKAVFLAADRLEMDLPFFLKLAGRVMVFPQGSKSPVLIEAGKAVRGVYLQAMAAVDVPLPDLEAAWDFFEAGFGQSLVNLRENEPPAVQVEHWIRFGVRGLSVSKPGAVTPVQVVVEKPAEVPVREVSAVEHVASEPVIAVAAEEVPEPVQAPTKAPKAPKAPKKRDDQTMLFDL